MDTSGASGVFQVPSFAKPKAYNFEAATNDDLEIYKELSAISEELEKCRLRNF